MESPGVNSCLSFCDSLGNSHSASILGGARKDANRRDAVNDRLVELESKIEGVGSRLDTVLEALESKLEDGRRQ